MGRPERRERWEAAFDPARLALAGAALSVLLLLQPTLAARAAMLAFAVAAAWLSGRRVSLLATAVVMAGIAAANLLVPVGRQLASIGPLVVTETALMEGLSKAVTFEALVYISKASLGPRLRLPGRLGAFFSEALQGYERILEQKARVRLPTFLNDIDEILISVYYGRDQGTDTIGGDAPASRPRRRACDIALLAVVLAAAIPVAFR